MIDGNSVTAIARPAIDWVQLFFTALCGGAAGAIIKIFYDMWAERNKIFMELFYLYKEFEINKLHLSLAYLKTPLTIGYLSLFMQNRYTNYIKHLEFLNEIFYLNYHFFIYNLDYKNPKKKEYFDSEKSNFLKKTGIVMKHIKIILEKSDKKRFLLLQLTT